MSTNEQQLIVNHHGGPALVVAGPGCGKTQTLIMTVKFALEKGSNSKYEHFSHLRLSKLKKFNAISFKSIEGTGSA